MNSEKAIDAKNTFSHFRNSGFRENQFDAIKFICESPKKVVVLCSPTGSGKSIVNMVAGRLHDEFTYLCSSKQLQRQLFNDFPEVKIMHGRNNFTCNLRPHLQADACSHSKETICDYKGKPCKDTDCLYEMQKCNVLAHPYKVLNYHYFLFECTYVGKFSNNQSIVMCDEADTIDNILTGFVSVEVSYKQIMELDINPPERSTATSATGLPSWEEWAFATNEKVKEKIKTLKNEMAHVDRDNEVAMVKKLNSYTSLKSKLDMFLVSMDSNWIFEVKKYYKGEGFSYVFRPTWITHELADAFFFSHGRKFVLTSATFPPAHVLAKTIGVDPEDIDYAEVGSSFPVENRPVYLSPVANMSYKTFDANLPKLLTEIQRILDLHPAEKGVIHTTSWKLNKHVMSMGNPRFITHTSNSFEKEARVAEFKESDPEAGAVFVSPSSIRGLDCPDDECRFIIVSKAPFLSLGDKLTKQRTYSSGLGQKWYQSQCAQDIVQSCGRGVRHKHDWCKTYILDVQALNLITGNRSLFPDYFMEAVEVL